MERITKDEYFKLIKKPKYNNKKTTNKRGVFASKLESDYEEQLFLRFKAKEFKDYATQVIIPIDVKGIHICNYIADFLIRHHKGAYEIVETKGVATAEFRIKWKLLQAIYGDHYKYTIVKKV